MPATNRLIDTKDFWTKSLVYINFSLVIVLKFCIKFRTLLSVLYVCIQLNAASVSFRKWFRNRSPSIPCVKQQPGVACHMVSEKKRPNITDTRYLYQLFSRTPSILRWRWLTVELMMTSTDQWTLATPHGRQPPFIPSFDSIDLLYWNDGEME